MREEKKKKKKGRVTSSLVQIKGLRKYAAMEVNCSQWETCDLQGSKVLGEEPRVSQFTRERCVVKRRKICMGPSFVWITNGPA